jgi:hypothetical protein
MSRILKHFRTNIIKHQLLNKFHFKTLADAKRSKLFKDKNFNAEEIYNVLMTAYNQVIYQERDKKYIASYTKNNEKAKQKRKAKIRLIDLPLYEIDLPDDFKYLIKNKFYITSHTFSYNLPKDFDFSNFFIKNNITNTEEFFHKHAKKLYDKLISFTSPRTYFRILVESLEHSNCQTQLKSFGTFSYIDFAARFFSSYSYDDLFTGKWVINTVSIPSGGGMIGDVPKFLLKRGITVIMNDDDYCGQRCLALADAKNKDDFKNMKKPALEKMWSKRAFSIADEIDVKGKMSFTDFDKYANLRKKQVIILSEMFQEAYSTEIVYPDKMYLYYDSKINHYHFIQDVNAATNDICRNSKWCHSCHKSFRFDTGAFAKHKCVENTCYFCKENFLSKDLLDNHFRNAHWVHCGICNCICPTNDCKTKHETMCKGKQIKCNKCKGYIDKNHFEKHICGEKFCAVCKSYYEGENHRCFITPYEKKEAVKGDIWVYDFESRFSNHVHIVNKCVAMKLYSDETFVCDTINEFVDFVLKKTNVTFIAHNGKAYDTWMVHKYLILNTNKRPNKLVLAGNKIMYMKINSIRFIDSLNHIAQSLKEFPKMFGITEMKKGFFPYLFNVESNAGYKGKIPDMKYFGVNEMSIDKKSIGNRFEFLDWYNSQINILYDFDKELLEYCISDVMILKRAMEIYIDDGITLTGINPIASPTIASYAMKVYRTNFLVDKKICVLTKEEYDFCKRGFFGGRTEVFQLKAIAEDIDDGKVIQYQDIQSLYPTVQFFDMLPCGIPTWDISPSINNIKEYLQNHFGYIECDIICPKYLHIPVLGEKKDCKLVFDLVDKTKVVYSSLELLKSLEKGYTISKVYKTLSFDKCDDLFKGYIQTFLKIKTECNGYDGDNIDDYIQRYYNHCGVHLDKSKVKSNNGMKLLAKILLNSLWGKFGQKDDLPTTEYYTEPNKWFRLLDKHINGNVVIKNETMIDENTLYVQYVSKETKTSSLNNTNLALAGFVTANARLRLYKELSQLNERVIYCDTDSIIYHYNPTLYNIKQGDMLGEWEPETKSPIVKVLALAPKSYGYICADGKSTIKCKGINLHYNNSKQFNFDNLENLISGNINKITTSKLEFVKDSKKGEIRTKEGAKKVITYNKDRFKRIVNNNWTTTPRTN